MNKTSVTTDQRIISLDGFRGLAILMVLFWHYIPCELHYTSTDDKFLSLLSIYLSWGGGFLFAGVDFFFVLSGFLIGKSLFSAPPTYTTALYFWQRRFLRLAPAYALALVFWYSLADRSAADHIPLVPYGVTLTQNVFQATHDTLGQPIGGAWSLSLELQFYIIAPLFFLLKGESRTLVLVMLTVAAPFIRTAVYAYAGWTPSFVLTPARMDSLFLGMLMADVLGRQATGLSAYHVKAILVLSLAFLPIQITYFPLGSSVTAVFGHTFFAVVAATLVAACASDAPLKITSLLKTRFIGELGRRSYFIYLFHAMLFYPTRELLGIPRGLGTYWAYLLIVIDFVTVYTLAGLSLRYIELPIMALGKSSLLSNHDTAVSQSAAPHPARR